MLSLCTVIFQQTNQAWSCIRTLLADSSQLRSGKTSKLLDSITFFRNSASSASSWRSHWWTRGWSVNFWLFFSLQSPEYSFISAVDTEESQKNCRFGKIGIILIKKLSIFYFLHPHSFRWWMPSHFPFKLCFSFIVLITVGFVVESSFLQMASGSRVDLVFLGSGSGQPGPGQDDLQARTFRRSEEADRTGLVRGLLFYIFVECV